MRLGYRSADVVVVGGGASGVIAALASARNGADTLLVDRYGFLGGMFTGGNMTVLNCAPAGGIGREIVDTLTEQGAAGRCPDDPPNYPIFHYASEYSTMNVVYDSEMAKILLYELVRRAGVRLLLHSYMTDVILDTDEITGVVVVNKSGKQVITGKVIIDATGDADVAAPAGVPFRKGQRGNVLFAMTMLVRLSNVDWPAVSEYSKGDCGLKDAIQKATTNGELPYYRPRTRQMPNYWGHARPEISHLLHADEALLWGGTVEGKDGTNVDDLTSAEIEVREQYMSELNFLKKYVPGFADARIQSTGVSVGVRDTRHIIGAQVLTGKDILKRRRFPDAVAYNIKGGFVANDIPYGCLVPQGVDNLLVCGNGISVIPGSTQMGLQLGSYNNVKDIPSMWTTGEAVGTAAAMCIVSGKNPRAIDVARLQRQLWEQGALIESERNEQLERQLLPSGKTIAQFYEELLTNMRTYWESRGDLIESATASR